MVDYNKLGQCIDNVYSSDISVCSARKVITKLEGNILKLDFRTIVNIDKKTDLNRQMSKLENEAVQHIKEKKKFIQACYKDLCSSTLKAKEVKSIKPEGQLEVLTVSSFSPNKTIKYSYSVCYEIS